MAHVARLLRDLIHLRRLNSEGECAAGSMAPKVPLEGRSRTEFDAPKNLTRFVRQDRHGFL
jgi:hypothetical protein